MIRYFFILTNIILVFSNVHNKNLKLFPKVYNNLRMLENNVPVLIGFNEYKYEGNQINFNMYFKDVNDKINQSNYLIFPVNLTYKNGDFVMNNNANCTDSIRRDKLIELHCKITDIKNDNITQVEFAENFNLDGKNEKIELSSLAKASKKNIINNREPRLSKGNIIFLDHAKMEKQTGTSFKIKGYNYDAFTDEKDIYSLFDTNKIKLVTINNGERQNVTCEGKNKKDENSEYYFYLSCKSSQPLNTNLSFAYGYFVNEKDKSILVDFDDENSTTIDNSYYQEKKASKTGLSTGGIIAIIIPSLIVLLGVLGLAMALRNKSPTSPIKDMANPNNTVGVIGTSSEAVVHQ